MCERHADNLIAVMFSSRLAFELQPQAGCHVELTELTKEVA
jgi:hypothetical protein